MGLLDLQECELDDEMEALATEERERRATIEEAADEAEAAFTRAGPTTRRAAVRDKKRNDRPPAPTPSTACGCDSGTCGRMSSVKPGSGAARSGAG